MTPPRPTSPAERYVLKDFRGSSHRLLAGWIQGLPAGTRILELGPGPAHVALLVRRGDLDWVGLEGSLDCLPGLRGTLSGGAIVDLETIGRLPRGYGAVLAADTLEHLADPDGMLRMIREALPKGGLLLLSVPNVANFYVRLNLLFGRFPYADRGILDRTHRYFFTARSLREMVERAGFVVERRAVSTIPLPLLLPRLPKPMLGALALALSAATRLLPGLLGYQLLLSARAQ
ncbi:MAG: class I SAM-dependent methyltransferase [Thermoanaerobaculia bacterium]